MTNCKDVFPYQGVRQSRPDFMATFIATLKKMSKFPQIRPFRGPKPISWTPIIVVRFLLQFQVLSLDVVLCAFKPNLTNPRAAQKKLLTESKRKKKRDLLFFPLSPRALFCTFIQI